MYEVVVNALGEQSTFCRGFWWSSGRAWRSMAGIALLSWHLSHWNRLTVQLKVAYELLDGSSHSFHLNHTRVVASGMKRDELLVCFPDRPWSHLRVWKPIEC